MLSKLFKWFISEGDNRTAAHSVDTDLEKVKPTHRVLPPKNTAMASYHEKIRRALQSQLDDPTPGQSLRIPPQEYPGPLSIKHPLVLDGQGATLWAFKGPVLSIEATHVIIKNLNIEVTGEGPFRHREEDCAICIRKPGKIQFKEVEVRGQVMGLKDETGSWHYPYSLHLGQLTQNQPHAFNFWLSVPVACQLESAIAGVHLNPTVLEAGLQEVHLHVDPLRQDTALYGHLYLQSAQIKRRIQLTAHSIPGDASVVETPASPILLWTPSFWHPPAQKSVTKKTTPPPESIQIPKSAAPDKIVPAQPAEVSKPTVPVHQAASISVTSKPIATAAVDTKTHLKRLENSVFFTEATQGNKANNQEEQQAQSSVENVFLKSEDESR